MSHDDFKDETKTAHPHDEADNQSSEQSSAESHGPDSEKTYTSRPQDLRRRSDAPDVLGRAPDQETAQSVARSLQRLLDGEFPGAREKVRTLLATGDFYPSVGLALEESRERTTNQLQAVLDSGLPHGAFPTEQGGTGKAGETLTAIEMIGHADLSLMVKTGVQWGLFGGAVSSLGTKRHWDLVRDIIDLRALGCFAMTERGHGSDVQNLETEAHYDPESEEFIINSPSPMAEKWFIGNAARDGRWAAVFCQLYTPGVEESHGVHCIVARIRTDDGTPVPGVTIGDHGYKGGLSGVDNGTISFDNYRVPRENLLNKFADVAVDGTYSSPIESDNARFFTMLGALIRGRITVGAAAGASARTALDIGVRYANVRRQFAADDSLPEKKLIEHRQHRRRLIPRIARAYGLQFATNTLIARFDEMESQNLDRTDLTPEQQADLRELEAHAAGLKAANTAHATDTIQEMREACGGAGYMAENLLTSMKADSDVFTTFEGDNTVMIQLTAKELMTGFAKELGGLKPMEMVRFGLDSFGTLLRRRTAATTIIQNLVDTFTDHEETSLFDPGFQMKLIEERENRLMLSLARRLRGAQKLDIDDAARVVDQAQDHLIAVGRAHVDRIIFESFLAAESALDDEVGTEVARSVLEQVRDIYFLQLIVDNSAWYLEQNMLSGTRTKAARAALNDLVDSVGPWSEVLVDAFGIPEAVRDVPMLQQREHAEG